MSSLFLRTLREDPADAEQPGHKLLVRAGYIRRAAPGIYTWLPLGLKVLRKVEAIVREEMEAIGSQELSFPALLPKEPYEATNRWTEYGDNLFRLVDRKDADMLLGPTHEEMFCLAVKDMYTSYKDLPLALFQIQTKYRDEARPRAGVLRGREFIMKDSYSFDVDAAGLQKAYDAHRDAYIKIFDRLGFEYVIVHADSGAMGGSASEEFLAVSPNGEDTFVRDASGYAANVEAVVVPQAPPVEVTAGPAHVEDTPDTPTIDTLVAALNASHPRTDGREWTGADTLKNVLVTLSTPPTRSTTSRGASRWPSACPATARSTPSASRRRWRRPRSRTSARPTSPPTPSWPRATSAPASWGPSGPPAFATCSTRASPRAAPGSPAATSTASTSSTSCTAVTSPPTARSRPPRSVRATRARPAPAR